MFLVLRGNVSVGQALLAACGFCRSVWERLEGDVVVGRAVIEMAERVARGEAAMDAMDRLFPVVNEVLSRRRYLPRGRRTPLEPVRSLFLPWGGSVGGMKWAATAARKATPRKQRAAVRAEQAGIIRRFCCNPHAGESGRA